MVHNPIGITNTLPELGDEVQASERQHHHPIKIIVIEDDEHIRSEVTDWLQFEGFEVVTAPNGRIGLEMIWREHPDLILCDIAMPELDGHEVLIEVRSTPAYSSTPFVFLTASAGRDAMRKGMNLGADDYLTKPFSHAEVLGTIRSRLEKRLSQERQVARHVAMLNTALHEEREKRLLKSRLVAMFSHDFRNPLASILMSSTLIRNYEDRLTPERKQQQLNRIDGAVHLLTQMLDEMLMVAEMESGTLEFLQQPVDILTFTRGIVDEFQLIYSQSHTLVLQNNLQEEVTLDGDTKLLRQLLANLICNAAKYSPPKTTITIMIGQTDDSVVLSVEDQGMGIPEESLPHIYEAFYRAYNAKTQKGTGLGLAIVKQAVDMHGGTIEVESVLDKGTRFTVSLPRTRTASA